MREYLALSIRQLAGMLLAGLFMTGLATAQDKETTSGDRLRPVTARDHIRGDPAAPVKVIEYADTECPLCKSFHPTMARLLQDYPGKIAWVFRHYPIDEFILKRAKKPKPPNAPQSWAGLPHFGNI